MKGTTLLVAWQKHYDYVAVVTVDESVAADGGDYAADGVANAVDYVAVVQGTGADVDSSCHAAAAAVQFPRGPTTAAVQHPRWENR